MWAVISAPGYLEEVHPYCAANPVRAWPGAGAHDTVEYHNGRVIERRFTAWQDGEGYDLEASDGNGPAAAVRWRLAPAAGGSELTIALTPRLHAPGAVRWAAHSVFRVMMPAYLQAVLQGVDWRVTTGEPVRPDQFGRHPWFSERGSRRPTPSTSSDRS